MEKDKFVFSSGIIKACIIACSLIFVYSPPAFPDFKIGAGYSYEFLGLVDLNNILLRDDMNFANSSGYGWQDSACSQEIGDGASLYICSELPLYDRYSLTCKLSYISYQGYKNLFKGGGSEFYSFTSEYSTFFIPIQVGEVYSMKFPSECVFLDMGISAGIGLAFAEKKISGITNIPGYVINNYTVPLWGFCPVVEGDLNLKTFITPTLYFSLNLGYYYSYVQRMISSKDVPAAGIKKNDALKDSGGRELRSNYSGALIGVKFDMDL